MVSTISAITSSFYSLIQHFPTNSDPKPNGNARFTITLVLNFVLLVFSILFNQERIMIMSAHF